MTTMAETNITPLANASNKEVFWQYYNTIRPKFTGFASILDFHLTDIGDGYAKGQILAGDIHMNNAALKVVHGAVISFLCDSVMALACWELFFVGMRSSTLELHTHYLSPVKLGELMECEARIIHRGKSHVLIVADVFVGKKKVAYSSATFNIWTPKEDMYKAKEYQQQKREEQKAKL